MATYVDLDGVRTWYDEHGEGEPLVLLHPGGVDSRAFGPNLDALTERFHTLLPERRGQGHTPDVEGPITFELMADDTIRFLERVVGGPARLLGVSDGAIVALLVARSRPDLVQQLVCIAGPFHLDGWIPEAIDPNSVPPDFMATGYGEVSPDGFEHYPVVVAKLAQAHLEEPTLSVDDLGRVTCRTLVMVGDDDEITLEHAVAFYRGLPNGELAIVPGTSHGLLVEKPDLCNKIIVDFLNVDPVPTLAPIRRRMEAHPPPDGYSFRSAKEMDAPHVDELVKAAYGHYVERIGMLPGPMTEDYTKVIRDRQVTVAESNGTITGVIVLGVDHDGFVIENVAVHPSHRGVGLGRALLELAEAEAERRGFGTIHLYTHERMTENLALYSRIGYVEYDRRSQGDFSLVYMRKPLG
jgi:pimeloyl-ACP methyl ester carboxylesterase/GNAT superfamily N-acetyltransferase